MIRNLQCNENSRPVNLIYPGKKLGIGMPFGLHEEGGSSDPRFDLDDNQVKYSLLPTFSNWLIDGLNWETIRGGCY